MESQQPLLHRPSLRSDVNQNLLNFFGQVHDVITPLSAPVEREMETNRQHMTYAATTVAILCCCKYIPCYIVGHRNLTFRQLKHICPCPAY